MSRPFDLLCAICLYVKEDTANQATTVIRGYAVCDDHLGYVAQGEEWFYILRAARREESSDPLSDSGHPQVPE